MCMQDLAINARLQWRRIYPPKVDPAGTFRVITQSPLRVSLIVTEAGGNPAGIWIGEPSASARVNASYFTLSGDVKVDCHISIRELPGIFSTDLFYDDDAGVYNVWECVMDSKLSSAVQALNLY